MRIPSDKQDKLHGCLEHLFNQVSRSRSRSRSASTRPDGCRTVCKGSSRRVRGGLKVQRSSEKQVAAARSELVTVDSNEATSGPGYLAEPPPHPSSPSLPSVSHSISPFISSFHRSLSFDSSCGARALWLPEEIFPRVNSSSGGGMEGWMEERGRDGGGVKHKPCCC